MKRLLIYLAIVVAVFMAGCNRSTPLPAGSFFVGAGIENNRLTIEGFAGSTKEFYISSKYPWSIEVCPGIECVPSSGEAGDRICIKATSHLTNNTLDIKELGALNFRVEKTRFVGVTVWLESIVTVEGGFSPKIYVDANQGATAQVELSSTLFDGSLNVTSQGDIEVAVQKRSDEEFAIAVEALLDNEVASERRIGTFSIDVDGDFQNSVIEVWQRPALILSVGRVLMNGQQGAESRFTVDSPFEVTARADSSTFAVESDAEGEFCIVATSENSTNERRRLGCVEFSMKSSPSEVLYKIEVWQRPAKAPQTIMCYCMGTALGSYFKDNISMMKSALAQNIQGESRFVLFLQSNNTTGKIVELYYDAVSGSVLEEVLVSKVDLPAVYDSNMLASILSQMVDAAPAHHYSLLIGSHGKAWIPRGISTSLSTMDTSYVDIWKKVEGALPTRSMGDTSDTQLDFTELAEACQAVGQRLDYILFDQCFASNVEALYELRDVAEYIVASPSEVMAYGFPYAKVLPLLLENGGTKYNLDAVASVYVDHYLNNMKNDNISACVAITVCRELDALAECVKRLNEAPQKDVIDLREIQVYEGLNMVNNPAHIFYDLEDAAIHACADEQVVEALSAQLNKTVISRYHTPSFYSAYNGKLNEIHHYCGLTTSAPMEFDPKSRYLYEWKMTQWYKATH